MRNIRLALSLLACVCFAGASAQYVPLRDGVIEVTVAPSGTCAADATAARNAPAQFVQSTGVTWYCSTSTLQWTASPSGGSGLSGLTSGRVPYATSSTTIGDDSGFGYDAPTDTATIAGQLRLGTAAGTSPNILDAQSTNDGAIVARIRNLSSGSSAYAGLNVLNDTGANATFSVFSSAFASPYGGSAMIYTNGAIPLLFGTNGAWRMALTSTGLGIGDSTPDVLLDVETNANATTEAKVTNTTDGAASQAILSAGSTTGGVSLGVRAPTWAGAAYQNRAFLRADSLADGLILATGKSGAPLVFHVTDTEVGRWTSTGLGIGKTPTTALDVQGNALVSGTLSHAGGDIGAATATTPSVGDNDTSVATTAFARAGFLSKNGYLVTVCASGCDYSTVQSALDGTTGTATDPVTIVLMPDEYSECVNVDETDDYKTLSSLGLYAATVTCSTGAESAIEYAGASGSDLDAFRIEGLTLKSTGAAGYAVNVDLSSKADARVDLVVARSKISQTDTNGIGVKFWGSAVSAPAKQPSQLVAFDNEVVSATHGFMVGQHANVFSTSNSFRVTNTGGAEAKCIGDHGVTGLWTGTILRSTGDDCEATSVANAGGIEVDTACGVCMYYGMERMLVQGMRVKASMTQTGTLSAKCWLTGTTTTTLPSGLMEVVGSTCDYTTGDAAQVAKAVALFGGARFHLRDVRVSGTGTGTENDIWLDSTSNAAGYIRYDGLTYDTLSDAGSGKFQALNPQVVKVNLRASDSVALPATGAPLDANSEYGLFDAAADENRSWRNERVSDLYDADSMQAAQFRVYWKPDTATSGDVIWRVGICAATNDGVFPCTVSSFASVTDTVSGGASGDLYISDWTALPTGILTAGYGLVVTASRDADNGSDTMTGDASLIGVEISYGVK